MSFDLYFAAGYVKEETELFNQLGCHRLFSWLEKTNVERWVEKCDNPDCKLFIDSGAFTAWTKGVEIDIDSYIDFLNKYDDHITIFADLDVITEQPQTVIDFSQADENAAKTWENYLYMRSRLKSPEKCLPVFHNCENWEWLINMLEYVDEEGKHIPYIGLAPKFGGSTGKEIFLEQCFRIIESSSNPNVKTHAFGLTDLSLLERFPLTSSDSTTYLQVAAYGSIMTEWGVVLMSDVQKSNPRNFTNMPKEAQDKILKLIEKYNLSLEDIQSDYKARRLFNIRYLKDWQDNYVYKPKRVKKKLLF